MMGLKPLLVLFLVVSVITASELERGQLYKPKTSFDPQVEKIQLYKQNGNMDEGKAKEEKLDSIILNKGGAFDLVEDEDEKTQGKGQELDQTDSNLKFVESGEAKDPLSDQWDKMDPGDYVDQERISVVGAEDIDKELDSDNDEKEDDDDDDGDDEDNDDDEEESDEDNRDDKNDVKEEILDWTNVKEELDQHTQDDEDAKNVIEWLSRPQDQNQEITDENSNVYNENKKFPNQIEIEIIPPQHNNYVYEEVIPIKSTQEDNQNLPVDVIDMFRFNKQERQEQESRNYQEFNQLINEFLDLTGEIRVDNQYEEKPIYGSRFDSPAQSVGNDIIATEYSQSQSEASKTGSRVVIYEQFIVYGRPQKVLPEARIENGEDLNSYEAIRVYSRRGLEALGFAGPILMLTGVFLIIVTIYMGLTLARKNNYSMPKKMKLEFSPNCNVDYEKLPSENI